MIFKKFCKEKNPNLVEFEWNCAYFLSFN